MSHRWDCPTEWEAESEGRRAGQRGYSRYSNPYTDTPGNDHCPEAEDAWQRGYRRGEWAREEEEREERAARSRAESRRMEAEAEEAYYAMQYEQEYYAGLEAEYYAGMEAEYIEEQTHLYNVETALLDIAAESLE